MTKLCSVVVALLVVGLAGCKDKCGPAERECTATHVSADTLASMITDQQVYTATGECSPVSHPCGVVSVSILFRNPLDRPVLLDRCMPDSKIPIFAVVHADSAHTPAPMNPDWACVGHESHLVVSPGGSRQDTVHLGLRPEQVATAVTELGPFRVAYLARTDTSNESLLPDSLRMSTPFRVRIAPRTSRP